MLTNWNILFWEYDFLSPNWLWLLAVVPIVIYFLLKKERNKHGEVKFSRNEKEQQFLATSWVVRLREAIILIYGLIMILFIFALAKPFHWNSQENFDENYKNGIDIIIAMDLSVSMLARDFEPNGTAIGTGLGTAVARLRNDSLPSKVVILLTDGSNNAGDISPETAAELAKAKNVRVYTIGVGSNGEALSPVPTPFGIRYEYAPVEIDEQTLKKIADKTGGQYFRATDEKSLALIYKEIEKLEKRKMLDKQYKSEPPATPGAFLNWAFLFILLTWIVNYSVFKINE